MSENETVSDLKEFKRKLKKPSTACKHIVASEPFMPGDKFVGFNVERNIGTDTAAWCDECENILQQEGSWTETALEFADFNYCCRWCFELMRQEKIARKNTI